MRVIKSTNNLCELMGKQKHYKLGKTEKVCVPICISERIKELIRVLDNAKDPNAILYKIIDLILFITSRETEDGQIK